MNARHELEPIVADWLRSEAVAAGSDRVLAAALAEIETVGQERYVTQRLFGDLGRSRRLRWAMLVVLALLALAGGIAIVASGLLPPRTPPIGGFEPGPSFVTARASQTMTLLQDGRVLVVGGRRHVEARVAVADSAELWDPGADAGLDDAGTFQVIAPPALERSEHTATLLPDGRVLFVGGSDEDPRAEIWDPATESFSLAGSLAETRRSHTATLLGDGRVLILGGVQVQPDGLREIALAEIWDPRSGTFSTAGELLPARSGHIATLLPDGHVLVVGGEANVSDQDPLRIAKLWDPLTRSFADAGTAERTRSGHTATLLADGRVLVIGGWATARTTEIWDPGTEAFTRAAPTSAERFAHTATLLVNGRVLIVGGSDDGSAEVWDPATESFLPTGWVRVVRNEPAAMLLADGRVLIAGHWTRGEGIPTTEIWNASIDPGPPAAPTPSPVGEPATPPPVPEGESARD
jgi:hypothetical protein